MAAGQATAPIPSKRTQNGCVGPVDGRFEGVPCLPDGGQCIRIAGVACRAREFCVRSLATLSNADITPLMNPEKKADLIRAAKQIQAEGAKDAGALSFMARMLVLATLPHSNPGRVPQFSRENGHFKLVVQPGPDMGIPYGSYPRLVLAWLTSEAVRTKSPELELGDSLTAFMNELGLTPTGGRWGTITRLREQMKRLFSARISAVREDEGRFQFSGLQVASEVDLWWDPKKPDQAAVFGSTVRLTEPFFEEIVRRPVPVDMRALRALKKSPLGLDLYTWLTYRLSYLKDPTEISWRDLHTQFGADYNRVRNFTQAVKRELNKILTVWPELRYETPRGRLRLYPCPPHVDRVESAAPEDLLDSPNGE